MGWSESLCLHFEWLGCEIKCQVSLHNRGEVYFLHKLALWAPVTRTDQMCGAEHLCPRFIYGMMLAHDSEQRAMCCSLWRTLITSAESDLQTYGFSLTHPPNAKQVSSWLHSIYVLRVIASHDSSTSMCCRKVTSLEVGCESVVQMAWTQKKR